MRAAVFEGPGSLHIRDVPAPVLLDSTDAIVRVTMASICTSDLHILAGEVPRAVQGIVLGHEFVGVVEQVGEDVRNIGVGDRVAVNCETFCGECFFCKHGWVNNCTHEYGGWTLGCRIDGGHAEHARVPFADNCLVRIPNRVDDRKALLTGDLMSTGYWAADIGGISEGDAVAVIGAGPTGLCCVMAARLRGAKAVVSDIDPGRLTFAERNGIGDAFASPEGLREILESMTDGRGADVVIECAGTEASFHQAWEVARPNATVVLVAMYGQDQVLPLPSMYGKNLTFRTGGVDGSRCGEIMKLVSEGRLDPSVLITHEFPFSRIEDAYRFFSSREDGVMKVAITFDE